MGAEITIKELMQKEADIWLKKLYNSRGKLRENFEEAFHAEKERKEKDKMVWALPPEERTYYMLYINANPVLLAGINQHLNISSFAKVTKEKEFKCKGRECVKKLIEDVLVYKCREANRTYFFVTTNERGEKVFECLKNSLPKGIRKIEIGEIREIGSRSVGCKLYISSDRVE